MAPPDFGRRGVGTGARANYLLAANARVVNSANRKFKEDNLYQQTEKIQTQSVSIKCVRPRGVTLRGPCYLVLKGSWRSNGALNLPPRRRNGTVLLQFGPLVLRGFPWRLVGYENNRHDIRVAAKPCYDCVGHRCCPVFLSP
jgi:hypothetical protein